MRAIINVKLILPNSILENFAILFEKKIIGIIPQVELKLEQKNVIDAGGLFLCPGFIDIHKHGAYDYDFMDAENSKAIKMLERLPETGVTSLYPTTMSMPFPDVTRTFESIRSLMQTEFTGADVLGCHMEGPFISPDWGGAQPREHIVPGDYKLLERYENVIKLVTVAPEEPGNMGFIRRCLDAGIVISLGHTLAHYEDAMEAFAVGARSVTHTFNAMHQIQHREPGVIAAASENPDVYCELIVDDLHIHPATQRVLLKLKGLDRILLVSDSMRFAGMGYGESTIAGQRVTINEYGAHLDNGFFAGSVLSLNDAVKKFKINNQLSMSEAIRPVTANPARLMRITDKKGSLNTGVDADLVLVDDNFNVYKTFVRGVEVYAA